MANSVTLEQLAGQLTDGARRLEDLTPVMAACAEAVRQDLYDRMAEGTTPDGEGYVPLRSERRHGGIQAGTPLAGTSLHAALGGGPGLVKEVTANSFTVGLSDPLSAIHQAGATIRRPEQRRRPPEKPFVFEKETGQTVFTYRIRSTVILIPARPHLGFSVASLNRCEDLLGSFTAAAVAGEPWTPAGSAP